MVPRIEVVALNINLSKEEILHTITQTGFSRFPVYRDSIDNIIGVIHSKDLIMEDTDGFSLSKIMKHPFFVPELIKPAPDFKDAG